MGETRAPDPTLAKVKERVTVSFGDHGGVAHLNAPYRPPGHVEVRDDWYSIAMMPAGVAAYVAVPCRECFPGSPPPGMSIQHSHLDEKKKRTCARCRNPEPGLAWQTGGA